MELEAMVVQELALALLALLPLMAVVGVVVRGLALLVPE
jgi:hypothetical protein